MGNKNVLKWAGGKSELSQKIISMFPKIMGKYYEPFIGGCSIFIKGRKSSLIKRSFLSDINPELINFFLIVRDSPEEMIKILRDFKNEKDFFLRIRSMDREEDWKYVDSAFKAARFLYLNRCSFNGLYRVNKKGQFNVPFGSYKRESFKDFDIILETSFLLKDSDIVCCDYKRIKGSLKKGDLVYFDPPYMPISNTSNFTSYYLEPFLLEEQIELAGFCREIDDIGVNFILSNSKTEKILDLYKGFNIEIVRVGRSISASSGSRKKVEEVIIKNIKEYVNQ